MIADLHLHTHFSDGTYSPEELVLHARRLEIAALSLTDHDSISGCQRMGRACDVAGIEFIPGAELTSAWQDRELHILGYGLETNSTEFTAKLVRQQEARSARIHEIVARLHGLGVELRSAAVFELAQGGSPGRPHVARALVQAGVCASVDEAFERFLKKHRPAWVPRSYPSAPEIIGLIHRAGGVASLAHPGLSRCEDALPALREAGLDGLECYHSTHVAAATAHFVSVATRLGLLVTGGSDCHGLNKGQPLIGTVRMPYEYFGLIKAAVSEKRGKLPRAAINL